MNLYELKFDLCQQTGSLGIQKWMIFEGTKSVGMHTIYNT